MDDWKHEDVEPYSKADAEAEWDEKQKNCPYCHSEKAIIQLFDEIQVYISNGLNSQSLVLVYDFSDDALTDEEFVNAPFGKLLNSKIKFCPMCGRDLRSDEK